MLGHGNDVGPRCVHYLDPTFGGGGDVDLVIPHAMSTNNAKFRSGIHERGVDGAGRADHQGVGVLDLALEHLGGEGRSHVQIAGRA